MKRDRVLEETRRGLAKTGFFLSRPHGERGLCFDLVARRDDTLLIVKVLQNVDALNKETAHELLEVARILEGSPLVVGERSGTGTLEDGVIYTRFGVSILSRRTLGEFLEEGVPPFLYSAPGGLYVRLDADALRRLREERQVSLGTLADIAGVTRRTIQMYLEGMSATMEVAMRLEEFLNESLVMPVDPFALLADPAAREERLTQIEGFEREMFERLERLGYRVLRTVRSPFDALQARGDDVPDGSRGGGPGPRTQGRGRVEPEPRRREGLGHVRGARPGPHEHPRRSRHRARGAAPRERSRRCRGDDLREEGLMDEVRLGLASVTILSVVRGLPSERSTVATAIRTTKPDVVALSIGPEELQTLRVYHGGPLEPENFEEEIYVAGLSAWEPPMKPPPCFTEAVRVAEKQGTRLEAIDMDEVTYTENYVDCVSTLEVIFQGRLERKLAKKRFDAKTPQEFVLAWDAEVNGPPGFARLQAMREAYMAVRVRQIADAESSILALIEVERSKGVLAALRS